MLELQGRTWTCGSDSGFNQRSNHRGVCLPSDLLAFTVRIPALHQAQACCKDTEGDVSEIALKITNSSGGCYELNCVSPTFIYPNPKCLRM